MKYPVEWGLYLVTDTGLSCGRPDEEIVACAIRGGARVVQYRDKDACTRRMIETARSLCGLCRAHRIPFLVNDRLDVALAVDADGIHVGQDDMPVPLARRLLGPGKILGVTAHTVEEALKAIEEGADYIGASPIFTTATKSDIGEPIGLNGLEKIAAACRVPVIGISGINAANADKVIRAGAAGVAVVSAIVSAEDVEKAARELTRIIAGCSPERHRTEKHRN
ncbi:MAG: Thiamine-phosphate synthase [Syntrophaceae bacterium PtaU1.Bin231]|nr:MAG: Thiamine-phosphate synthase [Syntrophaceae bacterium PtaU1.Bin231]